jgi:hypothetical protein
MKQGTSQLDASILGNPEARHAYYEQHRQNAQARERQVEATNQLNALSGIAQMEIEAVTKQPMTAEQIEKLRKRIRIALDRLPVQKN